jgi:Ala-tRNA(Pro) deacylase
VQGYRPAPCPGHANQRFKMPATPDDLFALLDRLGIAHQTASHPPLFTVEESRRLRGSIPGGHTKNLFLGDKRGRVFVVCALEDAAIDLKGVHHRLDAGRFSFGSAALMRELIGIEPGAVTPFALMNDTAGRVAVVLDAPMMRQEKSQFSSAGQHHDHDDLPRRPREVPGGDRASAAHPDGFRRRAGRARRALLALHSPRPWTM